MCNAQVGDFAHRYNMAWKQTTGIVLTAITLAGCSTLRPAESGQAAAPQAAETVVVSVPPTRPADERARNADGMRIARYTTAGAPPVAQAQDPMGIIARISYPRQTIRSVGDAVHHTLLRTGWRLDEGALADDARQVLALPLPDSQRTLGPYQVREILQVLLGGSWLWCEDPVRRTTMFMLKDGEGGSCQRAQNNTLDAVGAVPQAVQVPAVDVVDAGGEEQ